jgi:hypothetical protein
MSLVSTKEEVPRGHQLKRTELIRPIERSDDVREEDPWERSMCRGRGEWMMVGRIGRSMVPRASNLSYLTVLSTLLFVIFYITYLLHLPYY